MNANSTMEVNLEVGDKFSDYAALLKQIDRGLCTRTINAPLETAASDFGSNGDITPSDPSTPSTLYEPFQPQFKVKVTEPIKDGEVINYTVQSTRNTDGQEFSVIRQYEDFEWLHHCIITRSDIHGIIIPPLPPKPPVEARDTENKSKKQLGNTSKVLIADEFHKDCRSLEKYLKLMMVHQVLGTDRHFVNFLTVKEAVKRSKVKKGILGKLSTAVEEARKSSHRDMDEYFQKERDWAYIYLTSLRECNVGSKFPGLIIRDDQESRKDEFSFTELVLLDECICLTIIRKDKGYFLASCPTEQGSKFPGLIIRDDQESRKDEFSFTELVLLDECICLTIIRKDKGYFLASCPTEQNFQKVMNSQQRISRAYAHLSTTLNMGGGFHTSSECMANTILVKFSEALDDAKHGMDVDITNNANTLGFHFDFATRYAESVKEMHHRRTCLMVAYEDSNNVLAKAKPNKQEAAEEAKIEAERAFESCSEIARREIQTHNQQRLLSFQDALTVFTEAKVKTARDTYALLAKSLASLKQTDI